MFLTSGTNLVMHGMLNALMSFALVPSYNLKVNTNLISSALNIYFMNKNTLILESNYQEKQSLLGNVTPQFLI